MNLFLVGRAVSNTHNGMITLGTGNESVSIINGELPCAEYSVQTQHYKGIHCQSEMGFLRLFEH